MRADTQMRKVMLTINNHHECGLTNEVVAEILMQFVPTYFCMADEISGTGTPHKHVYFYTPSPTRFGTVKNRFPTAHIEKAIGSSKQNREYIRKEGKWASTDKAETSVEGSFYEYGEIPTEGAEKSPQMSQLMQDIRNGMSTAEIIEKSPNLAFRIRDIDALRQTLLAERYAVENRSLNVAYLHGETATGKTSSIYKRHDAKDVCRITSYRKNGGVLFDGYHGQDVLVFEEFHSQIPIEDMLNYLDVYPLSLPARYNDKTACYTFVYIISNSPLTEQYRDVQVRRAETFHAFLRRIDKIYEYRKDGTVMETERSNHG